ncbi:alpha/beta fold hydrolase [Aureibaculum sp. 2210JD6-5]|uniref:alpha/beta hydrolase family protein n=1 Tax=Aureibaculum sp. 2210JD6-5 TaxID=3103957 RepID=UPI002AACD50E|nr:alpha/beta fold hydrolase [Aureibaculum sp. 2210JD6-5]MDY7396111.1 alpha/beta fold hydrolase [Aureibaculum sp. 2210JD6-5]
MMLKKIKKIFKITGIIIAVLLIGLLIAAHIFFKPASDKKSIEELTTDYLQPKIIYNSYKGFEYRVVAMQKEIDTTKSTLVFIHGSPGSFLDYKRYLKDSILNTKANILSYDRVGYGTKNTGNVQGSIDFEMGVLHNVIKDIPTEKIILIGYSYGGSIILASPKTYKYKVSLASAVKADLEPMFWAMKIYDWKLTRWLLPKKVQAAAKEKYSHLKDLPKFYNKWSDSPSPIINIHGDKDWIVPYQNSIFLQNKIDADKFNMITIKDGGHELIWSDFELIKSEILKTLK